MLVILLKDRGFVGKGEWIAAGDSTESLGLRSFQGGVRAPTAIQVDAVINVYGANDIRFPVLLGTITLTNNSGSATDVFSDNFPFENYQAEVVSISGLNAAASVFVRV